MRVLYAYRDFLSRGVLPIYTRSMAAGVAATGAQVSAVCVASGPEASSVSHPPGVTVYFVPGGLKGRKDLRRLLLTLKPDVVHFPGPDSPRGRTRFPAQH